MLSTRWSGVLCKFRRRVSAKQSKASFLPDTMESFTKWSRLGYLPKIPKKSIRR
jgi:hypothetical protein